MPTPERSRLYEREDGSRVLGLIIPVRNEEGCWNSACHAHSSDQSVLGVLDVLIGVVTLAGLGVVAGVGVWKHRDPPPTRAFTRVSLALPATIGDLSGSHLVHFGHDQGRVRDRDRVSADRDAEAEGLRHHLAVGRRRAPETPADDVRRAYHCARRMVDLSADWNDARRASGEEPLAVSVGLHFGPVVVGDIGGFGGPGIPPVTGQGGQGPVWPYTIQQRDERATRGLSSPVRFRHKDDLPGIPTPLTTRFREKEHTCAH